MQQIDELIERLIYWIFFGLALAALPVLVSFTIIMLQHPGATWFDGWSESISKGDLLIISSALLGANLGDLSRKQPARRFRIYHFLLISVSVIISMFTLAIFVFLATAAKQPSHDVIANLSGAFLLITSAICIFSCLIE